MIKVNRHSLSTDDKALLDKKGDEEISKAFKHYITDRKTTTFKFSVYKNKSIPIKEELIKMFFGKCAYCESIIQNHPEEIEHFRPKSSITDKQGNNIQPGYFWLAADWNNFLLSCIDCNRQRNHPVPGENSFQNIGKNDQFPIADEDKRWVTYNSISEKNLEDSHCLLVDPCCQADDPEKYFLFTEEGFILPRQRNDEFLNEKAKTSIRVYALQRMGLVNARKEWYNEHIKRRLLEITSLMKQVENTIDPDIIDENNKKISKELKELIKLTSSSRPYSAMSKQLLRKMIPEVLGLDLYKYLKV